MKTALTESPLNQIGENENLKMVLFYLDAADGRDNYRLHDRE